MEHTTETKNCQNCKKDFVIEPDDFGFYEKWQVPPPSKCPECRQQLRTIFRNFKTLYKRPSSKSGKIVVSMYNPDVPFPVYEIPEWWGDDWDAISYGIDIDWDKPFFEQLKTLCDTVPHPCMMNTQSENCEYSNMVTKSKNCYLNFGCVENEDCDYGHVVWNSRDTVDNLYLMKCEACYECIDCLGSNKLFHSQECESCVESVGLFDCRNCLNCIGCVGLVGQSYNIFNKQLTKEEYNEFLLKHPLKEKSSIDYILKERDKLRTKLPVRSFFGFRNNNVSGNHIYNSRNIHHSFDVRGGENSKFCYTVRTAIDAYDISFTTDMSECYNSLTMYNSNKVIGSQTIIECHDVYYSENCYSSDNLFGCIGLRKKSYCIFNKQYSKQEYEKLLPRLIDKLKASGEWGDFFPPFMSAFAYNESIANEYMPLTKTEALAHGFRWKDDIPYTVGQGTIENSKLPKNPEDYNDELMNEVLTCETCEKNYKLINREINFYKRNKLSLPAQCFNCRHAARMNKRNKRSLWAGHCAKCNKEILTSYNPENQKTYKIYCESCYNKEVY